MALLDCRPSMRYTHGVQFTRPAVQVCDCNTTSHIPFVAAESHEAVDKISASRGPSATADTNLFSEFLRFCCRVTANMCKTVLY